MFSGCADSIRRTSVCLISGISQGARLVTRRHGAISHLIWHRPCIRARASRIDQFTCHVLYDSRELPDRRQL